MDSIIKKLTEFTRTYKANEDIFFEGDVGDCAYLIEKGQVEIYVGSGKNKTPVGMLGAGEIFGEMAIIDGSNRAASAMASTDAVVSIVSKETLNERIEESDPVVRLLITMLIDRMRKQLSDAKTYKVKKKKEKVVSKGNLSKIIDLTDANFEKNVVDKIRFEKELHEALEKDEFHLNFQPIIDTKSTRVVGFEALTRWNSPTHGPVRPDIFMGVAEQTSLILPLGQWILKQSCKEFGKINKAWKKQNNDDLFISINVSGRQLADKEFFNVLQTAAFKNKIKPKQIKLEITERVLITGNFAFNWIKKCRQLGYSVALDDFGTGYSSLQYLSRLDVNNIKIDKSFVQDMEKNENTMVIVKSIVEMSKGLGMTIIAEGIETDSQHKVLRGIGCSYSQGFLFYRPMTSTDVIETIIEKKIKKVA